MEKVKESKCSDLADLAFWIEKRETEQNCTKIIVSSVLNMSSFNASEACRLPGDRFTEVTNRMKLRSGTQGRGLSITTSALYQNFRLQASGTLNCLLILIILITLLLKPYLPLHPLNPQNLNSCALFSWRELPLGTASILGCVEGVQKGGRLAFKD